MYFVMPKTEAQQTLSVLHRMREALVRERTRANDQAHGFLLEFGISLPTGLATMKRLPSALSANTRCPPSWWCYCSGSISTFYTWTNRSRNWTYSWWSSWPRMIWGAVYTASQASARSRPGCWRLKWATGGSSRDFAASLGLVPHSTAWAFKTIYWASASEATSISGACWFRVLCTRVYLMRLAHQRGALADEVRTLLVRRHSNVAACTSAIELTRIAWAIAVRRTRHETGPCGFAACSR